MAPEPDIGAALGGSRHDELVEKARGCLLGGAVGDALGEPIEFMSLGEIRRRFGSEGLRDYVGDTGRISDDTQMTLFTAEGMIRANVRVTGRGICHPPTVIGHAYLRWLKTQGDESKNPLFDPDRFDGWLVGVSELHQRRAPGTTCLLALSGPKFGSVDQPLNDRKGCGGVMRVAPVGLSPVSDPFAVGCEAAALTHGHPTGYVAAGYLALLVRLLAWEHHTLEEAVVEATSRLESAETSSECLEAVNAATEAAAAFRAGQVADVAVAVEQLGGGWVAEEALSIALFCALTADSFEDGVLRAVNHSGDSDSTGAITGNILGAARGVEAIPEAWLERLELRDVIETVSVDICRPLDSYEQAEEMSVRYPGW